MVENGLSAGSGTTAIFIEETEVSSPVNERLMALKQSEVISWRWEDTGEIRTGKWSDTTETAIFLTQGRAAPIDQLENLKDWMRQHKFVLARIFTVVHCGLIQRHTALKPWYEACIHFSDVVLLNKREGISNKWVQDYRDQFTKACYPCFFESVKKGRLRNPISTLYPEPRRLSIYFESKEQADVKNIPDWNDITIEGDLPEEKDDIDYGDADIDPYIARVLEGQRKRPLLNIENYLPDQKEAEFRTVET